MARVICVANQKGGVGKTTTAVNTVAALALMKKRVLLVDLDPQGNATMGCGVDKHDIELSSLEVLLGEASVMQVKKPAVENLFDVLPANGDLTAAEVELIDMENREQQLKKALAAVANDYDYIFIDCPPSLNMLTLNALVAADGVLIPIQTEYYALEGLSSLLVTIDQIKAHANPGLMIDGIVRTMHDPRNNLATDVSAQLIEHFGDRVFRTIIPRNVRVAESPSHGLPVMLYDKSSRGAISYMALASELSRLH